MNHGDRLCSNITYVPDDNFEQALIDLGYDDVLDKQIITSSISGIKSLNVSNKNIVSLIGIEDFTELKILVCKDNQIVDLDLSNNLLLKNT